MTQDELATYIAEARDRVLEADPSDAEVVVTELRLYCTFHDLLVTERDGCSWFMDKAGFSVPEPGDSDDRVTVGICKRCAHARWKKIEDGL